MMPSGREAVATQRQQRGVAKRGGLERQSRDNGPRYALLT